MQGAPLRALQLTWQMWLINWASRHSLWLASGAPVGAPLHHVDQRALQMVWQMSLVRRT